MTRSKKTSSKTANAAMSKKNRLRDLLARQRGASLDEICKTFGWQPHSARAAISGLRKAGHDVERKRGEGCKHAAYRLVTKEAQK